MKKLAIDENNSNNSIITVTVTITSVTLKYFCVYFLSSLFLSLSLLLLYGVVHEARINVKSNHFSTCY